MKIKAFHTSLTNFEAFDAAFIGSSTGHCGVVSGFYFSPDKNHASHKAEGSEEDGWITYEVELDLANPFVCKRYADCEKWGEGNEATAALTAAGHDAVIMVDEIIVWDASKITILNKTK